MTSKKSPQKTIEPGNPNQPLATMNSRLFLASRARRSVARTAIMAVRSIVTQKGVPSSFPRLVEHLDEV